MSSRQGLQRPAAPRPASQRTAPRECTACGGAGDGGMRGMRGSPRQQQHHPMLPPGAPTNATAPRRMRPRDPAATPDGPLADSPPRR